MHTRHCLLQYCHTLNLRLQYNSYWKTSRLNPVSRNCIPCFGSCGSAPDTGMSTERTGFNSCQACVGPRLQVWSTARSWKVCHLGKNFKPTCLNHSQSPLIASPEPLDAWLATSLGPRFLIFCDCCAFLGEIFAGVWNLTIINSGLGPFETWPQLKRGFKLNTCDECTHWSANNYMVVAETFEIQIIINKCKNANPLNCKNAHKMFSTLCCICLLLLQLQDELGGLALALRAALVILQWSRF